jgi:hypothetical protein
MNPWHRTISARATVTLVTILYLGIVGCGSGPIQPSTASPPVTASATPDASALAGGDPISGELRSRWMGGHRDVPGVEPVAGTTIIFSESDFALTQSNGIEDELLRSAASLIEGGPLRLELTADAGACATGDIGRYAWSLSESGRVLTITAQKDDCALRLASVPGTWWRMGCKDPGGDTCLGDLDAGTYQSQFITPRTDPGAEWSSDFGALSYTVPDGWANNADYPHTFSLMPASDYATVTGDAPDLDASILLFAQPVAVAQDPPCTDTPQAGVDRSVDAEMDWVRQLPGLVATKPVPITIDGFRGAWTDLAVDSAWVGECEVLEYLIPSDDEAVGIAGTERQRLILVDLGDGDLLGIRIFARDPGRFAALADEAMPIIQSFRFE